jgi:16S rRNA G966 N2-methylase RsmD
MRQAAFPYFGSKARPKMLAGILPFIQGDLLVEPFAGSAAVSIAWSNETGKPWIGYEINPLVCDVWWWLKEQTEASMSALRLDAARVVESARQKSGSFKPTCGGPPHPNTPPLASEITSDKPAQIWLGAVSSLVKGQIQENSRIVREPDVSSVIRALPAIRRGNVLNTSGLNAVEQDSKRTTFFVDPPYHGTSTYNGVGTDQGIVRSLLDRIQGGTIVLTYGEGARERWPELEWEILIEKGVGGPKLAGGGKVRRDFIAHRPGGEK